MVLVNFLFLRKKTPANIAKKRLQDVISEHNKIKNINNHPPYYLYQLKKDLTQTIHKYISDPYILSVQLEKENNIFVLKCKVIFSNEKK